MTLKSYAKFEKKEELWFEKWFEKFGKFSSEHLKMSKLRFWWDPFVQSRKCMSLKFTEELSLVAMKNDAKFEEELTCHLTWGIWQILTQTLENLKSLLFNWLLWPKYIMFELKSYRRAMFDGTEDWRKTDLCFEKWHEEFDKFA